MDEMNKEQIEARQKKYQSFLRAINCCPLCASPLTLIHEVFEGEELIKETAQCDNCDVETRKIEHPRH